MNKTRRNILFMIAASACLAGCNSNLTRDDLVPLPACSTGAQAEYNTSAVLMVKKMRSAPASDRERIMATGIFSPSLTPDAPFAAPQNQASFNDPQNDAPDLLQRLLTEALTMRGYSLISGSGNAAADLLTVGRIIEPVFILQRSVALRDEYASDLLLVVELREPPSLQIGDVPRGDSRFFQSWSRCFVAASSGDIRAIFVENCARAVENLFNNPEFRKALEPDGMKPPAE